MIGVTVTSIIANNHSDVVMKINLCWVVKPTTTDNEV